MKKQLSAETLEKLRKLSPESREKIAKLAAEAEVIREIERRIALRSQEKPKLK